MSKKTEREEPSKSSSPRTPDLTTALGADDLKPARPQSKRSPSTEVEELRALVDQQTRNIGELTSRVDSILERQDRVVSAFYDLKLSVAMTERAEGEPPAEGSDDPEAARKVAYFESVRTVREVVRRFLPRDAVLLVASKGHDELLDLHGRPSVALPPDGRRHLPGDYPQDGHAVIGQLEALRSRGADYLVFPWSRSGGSSPIRSSPSTFTSTIQPSSTIRGPA